MADAPIEAVFLAHEDDIRRAKDALASIEQSLRSVPVSEDADARTLHHPYRACKKFLAKVEAVEERLERVKILTLEYQFNAYWLGKLRRRDDIADYDKKRAVAKEMNADLRAYGYAIRHPETAAPCLLLASSSPDGKGRYVLSDRLTRKRSHTSLSLLDLLPLRLVPEPRRRESFLEKADDTGD